MCVTLSPEDEDSEKGTAEIDSPTTDNQSDALMVRNYFVLSPSNWIGK